MVLDMTYGKGDVIGLSRSKGPGWFRLERIQVRANDVADTHLARVTVCTVGYHAR